MADFFKIQNSHQFTPHPYIVNSMLLNSNHVVYDICIYEDGWVFVDWDAIKAQYDWSGNTLKSHTGATLTKPDIGEPGSKSSRYPHPIIIGNIFTLNHYDESDCLVKGNMSRASSHTSLPMPKDPSIFVESFCIMNTASSKVLDGLYPEKKFDEKFRGMHYYTIRTPLRNNNPAGTDWLSRFMDVTASAKFFRQFYRINSARDDTDAKLVASDPNNSSTIFEI